MWRRLGCRHSWATEREREREKKKKAARMEGEEWRKPTRRSTPFGPRRGSAGEFVCPFVSWLVTPEPPPSGLPFRYNSLLQYSTTVVHERAPLLCGLLADGACLEVGHGAAVICSLKRSNLFSIKAFCGNVGGGWRRILLAPP